MAKTSGVDTVLIVTPTNIYLACGDRAGMIRAVAYAAGPHNRVTLGRMGSYKFPVNPHTLA